MVCVMGGSGPQGAKSVLSVGPGQVNGRVYKRAYGGQSLITLGTGVCSSRLDHWPKDDHTLLE